MSIFNYSFIPYEIDLYILSFLEPRDLCSCSQVSNSWKLVSESNQIWHRHALQLAQQKGIPQNNSSNPLPSYKGFYMQIKFRDLFLLDQFKKAVANPLLESEQVWQVFSSLTTCSLKCHVLATPLSEMVLTQLDKALESSFEQKADSSHFIKQFPHDPKILKVIDEVRNMSIPSPKNDLSVRGVFFRAHKRKREIEYNS